jgi:hypothetical protein
LSGMEHVPLFGVGTPLVGMRGDDAGWNMGRQSQCKLA